MAERLAFLTSGLLPPGRKFAEINDLLVVKPEVEELIEKFISLLGRKGTRVEKVILYGSFVSGDIHGGGDIDLAMVSPDFGRGRYDEGKLLFQMAWKVDPGIEPVRISSESYANDTRLPLIYVLSR